MLILNTYLLKAQPRYRTIPVNPKHYKYNQAVKLDIIKLKNIRQYRKKLFEKLICLMRMGL